MPEMLDPTSRITALCRSRNITIALVTDGRFSGGSVGLAIGHVAPEAYLGGPIALLRDGDTITIDLASNRIDCHELDDPTTRQHRANDWNDAAATNGGVHPSTKPVTTRVLARMRANAAPALQGAGVHNVSQLPATTPTSTDDDQPLPRGYAPPRAQSRGQDVRDARIAAEPVLEV
jgi:dihydroxy-acid dehydratase